MAWPHFWLIHRNGEGAFGAQIDSVCHANQGCLAPGQQSTVAQDQDAAQSEDLIDRKTPSV
jgi:hypothetical protein